MRSRSTKLSLSPTRIAAYLECAVKYRYLYIDRIGKYYPPKHPGISLGATLHLALRAYHSGTGTRSEAEIAEQFERSWIPLRFESPEQEAEFRNAGAAMVRAYHAAALQRADLQAETLFTEREVKSDMGPFMLAGRVDRVDRHPDGSLEIVDYKSGRLHTSPQEVAADLAMGIYQIILRRNYPGTRVFGTIYCLRSGMQASAEMTEPAAEEFERDILTIGEEIIARDFDEALPVRIEACAECSFLRRCERYWRFSQVGE